MGVNLTVGYTAKFQVALVDPNSGLPVDLTGATQISAALPGVTNSAPQAAVNQPIVENLATLGTVTANTTSGSQALANLSAAVEVGMQVTGAGIPDDTFVQSVINGVTAISNAATATATGVTLTIGNANVTVPGAPGSGIIEIDMPAAHAALLGANTTAQTLQVGITNADGSTTAVELAGYLNIAAPAYGIV